MPNENSADSSGKPTDDSRFGLSRRQVLGGLSAMGTGAVLGGASTLSLLSDTETYGNATNPNVLRSGAVNLEVDWTVRYYDWIADTPRVISESDFTDQPGPIVTLEDVKPGDVIGKRLGARVSGNPAFLSIHCELLEDSDNGITEPEDVTNGRGLDGSDGTPGGDLGDALRMVVWFDDGDGLPQEIWAESSFPDTREDYVRAVGDADQPGDVFDLTSANLVGAGTAAELCTGRHLLDPRVNGHVADDFPDTACYQSSTTESIGVLMWIPRDPLGTLDNIIQTDRCEYMIGFDAVQCRHNVASDGGPINGTLSIRQPPLLIYRIELTQVPLNRPVQFESQLGDGNGELTVLAYLIEPVVKGFDQENPASPPEPPKNPPDLLPLTGYELSGGDVPEKNNVELRDQFGESRHGVGVPEILCDPVEKKIVEKEKPGEQFLAPLVLYDIAPRTVPNVTIRTRDQFTTQELSIGELEFLAEPIKKDDEPGESIDIDRLKPYRCYKVTRGDPVNESVALEDQFDRYSGIRVVEPVYFCDPATKKIIREEIDP